MIEFRSHASGSAGNLYTASDSEHMLAIECGLAYRELQRALGFRVTRLDGALVSHCHGDHARSIPDVMKAGVNVYASRGTFDALDVAGHRVKAVRALEQIRVGPWTVLPFDTVHDAPEPLGYMVEGPSGDRLLYASDTAFVPYRFPRLSVIAVEANYNSEILKANAEAGAIPAAHAARVLRNHMSLERAIDLLQANDLTHVREVVLLHLSDSNSHADDFKRAVERATGKPARIADARSLEGATP